MYAVNTAEIAQRQRGTSGQSPNWVEPLQGWTALMLFFAVVLTYLAAAAVAAALGRAGWIGRTARRGYVGTS